MNEWLMILGMALGGVLFAAGGTDIPSVGGQKWIRRFVLATAFGALAFFSRVVWWKCLILAGGFSGAFHLPYGSKSPYWVKTLTAIAFIAPTFVLGFCWWQVFTPLSFLGMFWLSNSNWGRLFPWAVVEFLTGVYVSVTLEILIPHRSLTMISSM